MQRSLLPFFIAVKQIRLFNTLEKIESVVIAAWVMADFLIICFFAIIALRLMKFCISFNEEKNLVNILIVFIGLFSFYLTQSIFDLEKFSRYFILPGNVILGYVIPIVMFSVGKLRRRI
jgi:hypothetical protein